MSQEFFPIITTPNLEPMLDFYGERLGGRVEYRFPEKGQPVYLGLRLADSQLGIAFAPEIAAGGRQRLALWLYVASCDATVESLASAGATVVEEPTDQPWGERVARVLDPDGNEVLIGERAPGGLDAQG